MAGCLLLPTTALAQSDVATAEALFSDARALSQAGEHARACSKYAESHRLDPGVGVLFFLADCYEKTDRLAQAWATYREAARAAESRGQSERVTAARQRIEQLEARLARLKIQVDMSVSGVEVRLDDTVLRAAAMGTELRVDPGTHEVRVSAPNYEPHMVEVTLEAGGIRVLRIPGLSPSQPQAPPNSEVSTPRVQPGARGRDSEPKQASSWRQTSAWGLVGLGAVGVGVGSVLGVLTIRSWDAASAHCSGSGTLECDSKGLRAGRRADDYGFWSTITFIAGGTALAAAVTLWLTEPKESNSPSLVLRVAPGVAALQSQW